MENNRNNYNTGGANGAPQDDEYMTMYAGNEPQNGQNMQNSQYDPNAQYQQNAQQYQQGYGYDQQGYQDQQYYQDYQDYQNYTGGYQQDHYQPQPNYYQPQKKKSHVIAIAGMVSVFVVCVSAVLIAFMLRTGGTQGWCRGGMLQPADLSSGVQMRLSGVSGYVSGKDGDFYFVMISNGIGGWVNKGQLTFN